MKILLIDVNCKFSSTGKISYDLFTELNNQNHIASVAYGRGPKINEPRIIKYGYDLETIFHAIMTRITGLTGYFSVFSTRRLIRHIIEFQPDIVHLQDLHGYHVNIGKVVNYLKKTNIRTVWTFQSEFNYTGKCGHAKDCRGFEENCGNCPLLREYPKSLLIDFTRFMLKQKKEWFKEWSNLVIIAPSKWVKYRIEKSFLRDFSVSIIENGIDISVFNKDYSDRQFENYRTQFSKFILNIIPNLYDAEKGFKWVQDLSNEEKLRNFLFIIITKGVKKSTLKNNLLFIPYKNNQTELAKIYSSVDLFLVTSKYESYSMISLEAIACGLSVAGFSVGGIPDAIQGNDKFMVDYGSPDIINKILEALFDSGTELNLDYYKISRLRMLKEYINVYEN